MATQSSSKIRKAVEIKFETTDKQIISMSEQVAKCSPVLAKLLNAPDRKEPIQVPNLEKNIFEKVVEYCTLHKFDPPVPPELEDKDLADICQNDKQFLKNIKRDQLFELINAAENLEIHGLMRLVCRQVAESIKGLKIEEIRTLFNVTNDFSEAELTQIDNENNFFDKDFVL